MKKSGTRLNLVVLDACRNNPFKRGAGGLATMENAKGTLIAYATDSGSTANDNPNEENGLFTKHFLNTLDEPLNQRELFYKIRKGVHDASDGRQLPYLNDGTIGDFFFVKDTKYLEKNIDISEIGEEAIFLSPDGYMRIKNVEGITENFLTNYLKYILSHLDSNYSSSSHLKFISETVALKNGSENYYTAHLKWKDINEHPLSKEKLPKFWEKSFSFLNTINDKDIESLVLHIVKKQPLVVNNINYGTRITVAVAIPNVKLPKSGSWNFFIINNKVYWSPF
jgi:hypothetical protein